ncbi:ABC transporter ATP-binding protein [Phreatobacter sp. HK31-P]
MTMLSGQGLVADGLSVAYGDRIVVRDASFALAPGQIVALIGPNGAGKTSLLRALAGLAPATGRLTIDGVDAAGMAPRDRARRIAYLPQGHAVHWPLNARDVVALGRYPHGVNDPSRMGERDSAIVDEAMERTDAAAFAARNILTLSGGERARVMLARVFAVEAGVLLADEPTAALDPRHQIGIMEALRSESRRGRLVIAVTHDIGLAARMADLVMVIDAGRISALGPPAEVMTPALLRDVYGVEALSFDHQGQPVLVPWSPT